MTIRNLQFLLGPKSVALIGASPQAGSIGKIIANNLLGGGFAGPVWLVNPRHSLIDGERCFASVDALPGVPDLAVIATPPATIPQLIADLGRRGTRAAVVISAGMTPPLRQAMLDAARPHLLRIQGPNCLGLMLPEFGLNASFGHRNPLAGDLALVSQSGAVVAAIVDWASGRNIGFSQIMSLGDMADVDFGDTLDYLAGDTKSRAILLYIEQLTHAAKFMSAARRAARVKPVVVIKAGRHAEGAKAALSHTGALAGSDAAYEAAFRRAGVLRVNELQDLFNAAEMLARLPHLDGERLTILTNGGGAGVLAADRLADFGGTLAELSDTTQQALNAVLPKTWSKGNPVDIIGDANANRYAKALDCLMADDGSDAILVMNCPTALTSSTAIAQAVVQAKSRRHKDGKADKPLLANWLGDGAVKQARELFARERIATFETPASAIEGFMQLVRYTRAQNELMRTPPPLPDDMTFDVTAARSVIQAAQARGQTMLTEVEAKLLLSAYGIPVVPTVTAKTSAEAALIAEGMLSGSSAAKACVVKILSDDITHKSDVGGVRLGLETAAAVGDAARDMLERIAREHPAARIQGVTVQPMIRRPRAHELIIGMSVDTTFGPMLTFGAGGTAVEVLRDTAQALPPIDLQLARDLMRQTRVQKLLDGYRDRPQADLAAIALTLVKISALVIAHPEILELDINPLLADETGVIALDARVRVAGANEAPRQPLSIKPYPVNWERRVSLPMIGDVLQRPIRPEDELLYGRLMERLTTEDMRMRFFIGHPHHSHKLIARLTQIDYAREMAFVAISQQTGELLGVARLIADPDYRRAEYAVIVASDLKGRGLGWSLMQHLIDYARHEGLSELFGDVLSENTAMLQMCREFGFKIEAQADDMTLTRVTLDLTHSPN
jgi:acetyltransferase